MEADTNLINEVRIITRDLPCKLTDTERLAKGDELVQAQTEINELQAQKLQLTALQKPIQKQVGKLVRLLKAGEEIRPVKCHKIMLDESNEVSVVRMDTLEEIERRTQSPEERQESFRIVADEDASNGADEIELAAQSASVHQLHPQQ